MGEIAQKSKCNSIVILVCKIKVVLTLIIFTHVDDEYEGYDVLVICF